MLYANSGAVIECAGQILGQQASVPKSPAERDSKGNVNLCLAAAVAQAGFLLRGSTSQATELAEELARTKSKDRLRCAFVQLGWDVADCNAKLGFNDQAPDATRKADVLAYLGSAAVDAEPAS